MERGRDESKFKGGKVKGRNQNLELNLQFVANSIFYSES